MLSTDIRNKYSVTTSKSQLQTLPRKSLLFLTPTVVGVLKSSTDHLLIKAEQEELNDPPKLSGSKTRHMYPRHNQTATHNETQKLIARIDTLEKDMNKQTETVLDNSERLARIETLIVHGSVVANTSDILGTTNETSKPSCVDFFTLNKTVMTIEANIEKQTEMTGEVLHNYTAIPTELVTDMNAHQNAINHYRKAFQSPMIQWSSWWL